MSDNHLTVIPTAPHWQPDRAAADRAAALITRLCPGIHSGHVESHWHDTVTLVLCGSNLKSVGCPRCHGRPDLSDWAFARIDDAYRTGFADLDAETPCCGATVSLNDLDYRWPCGFARFQLDVIYPDRGWLTDEELAAVTDALGHPVRQILSHF
ncbi:hypothetical protein [Streptomyces sp. NPDC020298]|uniref:hypothetical protein n=1 Tax=unclassified Streptomyces TaxID=2593676 RepID=UPI0033F0E70E